MYAIRSYYVPKEWVDANNLDKSSQVEIETGQDTISISANKENRPTKELVISYPLPRITSYNVCYTKLLRER